MPHDPCLSVVVCTHDRPDELRRCLAALALLEDPAEVIVVDSASHPPCDEVVAAFAADIPGLRHVYEPQPGLSRARNRGVALARGDLVAFVDDDAAVAPDWCRRIVGAFDDPEVACVGGTCVADLRGPRPRWLSDRLLQYAGITCFPALPREARSRAEYPFGANVCFRRALLVALGGFPENLGRIGTALLSGEESAVIDALRRAEWRIWIEPAAVVRHAVDPARLRARYYWRRLWWQGIGRARGRQASDRWLSARLLAGAPARLALWPLTRDAVHLFRVAETAGYLWERAREARAR